MLLKKEYNTKEECIKAIEKQNVVYLDEDVYRDDMGFLLAPLQKYENQKWVIQKEKEHSTQKQDITSGFLTVKKLKQWIEDDEIDENTILCFEKANGKCVLLTEGGSYDYLICNETTQKLPIDKIGELESRRYRDIMVLKLS